MDERTDEPQNTYMLHHLAYHLARSLRWEELNDLVAGTASRKWADERQAAEGAYSGYLNDIELIREHAELIQQESEDLDRGKWLGRQVRYAAIMVSIRSTAGQAPVELLCALVDERIWTVQRTLLAVAELAEDERSSALAALAPHVGSTGSEQLLNLALSIADGPARFQALLGELPHLAPEIRREASQAALEALKLIRLPPERIQSLVDLAPFLSESEKATWCIQALKEADEEIVDRRERFVAFIRLLPILTEPMRSATADQAIALVQELDEAERVGACALLANAAPDSHIRATLDLMRLVAADAGLRNIKDGLLSLARRLPHDALPDAVEIARMIHTQSSRAEALVTLGELMSGSAGQELVDEAISVVLAVDDHDLREQLLGTLCIQMATAGFREEALKTAASITAIHHRSTALASIAVKLPEPLQRQTIDHVLKLVAPHWVRHRDSRAEVFLSLAPYLPEDKVRIALQTVKDLRWDWLRNIALWKLLVRLASLGHEQEAVQRAGQVKDPVFRMETLTRVAAVLHEPLRSQALHAALAAGRQIPIDSRLASQLIALAPLLPEDERRRALLEAVDTRQIGHADEFARARATYASLLSALQIINLPDHSGLPTGAAEKVRALSLKGMATVRKAVANRRERNSDIRAGSETRTLKEEKGKAIEALLAAGYVPEPANQSALQVWALISRAERLAPELLLAAYLGVWTLAPSGALSRHAGLSALAPHLPELLVGHALGIAEEATETWVKEYVVSALAPYLSEPCLRRAWAMVEGVLLPGEMFDQEHMDAMVSRMIQPGDPSETRESVALRFAVLGCAEDAMKVLNTFLLTKSRARRLSKLIPAFRHLPRQRLAPIWHAELHLLAQGRRDILLQCVSTWAPILSALGGCEAVEEILRALRDVEYSWP